MSKLIKSGPVVLAVDLGASSGRVMVGGWDARQLQLEEIHRFPNGGVQANGQLMWNWLSLWQGVQDGLRQAASQYGDRIQSIGVDTWGVDFALIASDGQLAHSPTHHRDSRTRGMMDKLFEIVPREEVFAATGLQFLEINTLFQLFAMRLNDAVALDNADRLLMMPDMFHWLLSGELSNELTDASTTQMLNPHNHQWARQLVEKVGIPGDILGPLSDPGTVLGPITSEVQQITGLPGKVKIILPPAHDTASAVASVPATGTQHWAFISSGTWSCMGVELASPCLNAAAQKYNFTNEIGINRTTRLLKNITGMWLLQQCQVSWQRNNTQSVEWDALIQLAAKSPPAETLIFPDDAAFVAPLDMVEAIQKFAASTDQPVPQSPGQITRCCLESIALRYRQVLLWLEEVTGQGIERIHIIGGGSQNRFLNQLTADITARPVTAGPVEATAIGSVCTQLTALGHLGSHQQSRQAIGESFAATEFSPDRHFDYAEAISRFAQLEQRQTS